VKKLASAHTNTSSDCATQLVPAAVCSVLYHETDDGAVLLTLPARQKGEDSSARGGSPDSTYTLQDNWYGKCQWQDDFQHCRLYGVELRL
jgi:hypothetical protein